MKLKLVFIVFIITNISIFSNNLGFGLETNICGLSNHSSNYHMGILLYYSRFALGIGKLVDIPENTDSNSIVIETFDAEGYTGTIGFRINDGKKNKIYLNLGLFSGKTFDRSNLTFDMFSKNQTKIEKVSYYFVGIDYIFKNNIGISTDFSRHYFTLGVSYNLFVKLK